MKMSVVSSHEVMKNSTCTVVVASLTVSAIALTAASDSPNNPWLTPVTHGRWVSCRFIRIRLSTPAGMTAPGGRSGISAVRSVMILFASAWTLARRPRTNGLPINKKITRPKIGVTTISNNHAIDEDGRRLFGTVPSATILIVNSTRYKIKGAQAIAFTDSTSRIWATTIGHRLGDGLTCDG